LAVNRLREVCSVISRQGARLDRGAVRAFGQGVASRLAHLFEHIDHAALSARLSLRQGTFYSSGLKTGVAG
jgi:hypothetical protein